MNIYFIQFITVKSLKLFPLIKEWKLYYQFCNSKDFRISLFYLQKKAFQVFNKESKQDRYSTKKLLDRSFKFPVNFINHFNFLIYGTHIGFCIDFSSSFSNLFVREKNSCIHCGMNLFFK